MHVSYFPLDLHHGIFSSFFLSLKTLKGFVDWNEITKQRSGIVDNHQRNKHLEIESKVG